MIENNLETSLILSENLKKIYGIECYQIYSTNHHDPGVHKQQKTFQINTHCAQRQSTIHAHYNTMFFKL